MSTTEVALLAALIGFAGGSLMATIIGAFVTHLIFHPVISVRLDKRKGSYGDVPIDFTFTDEAGKERKERMPAKFLRLHVENTGRSSIKACSGYIVKLRKRVGAAESRSEQEVLDLGWANRSESKARDIPRGAFFHMDVATLLLPPSGGSALRWERLPNTLLDFFTPGKATYLFDILVAADNARPRSILVEFTFDPVSRELEDIKWRRKAQYPWWSWWRRLRNRWQVWREG